MGSTEKVEKLKKQIPKKTLDSIDIVLENFKKQFSVVVNDCVGSNHSGEVIEDILDEKLDKVVVERILTSITEMDKGLRILVMEQAKLVGTKTETLEYLVELLKSSAELFDLYTYLYINL